MTLSPGDKLPPLSDYAAELLGKVVGHRSNADEAYALVRKVWRDAREDYAAELLRTAGYEEKLIEDLRQAGRRAANETPPAEFVRPDVPPVEPAPTPKSWRSRMYDAVLSYRTL